MKDRKQYFFCLSALVGFLYLTTMIEINADAEYEAALSRMLVIFEAKDGTPEAKELTQLANAIEAYEAIHYPIGPPMPG